MREDELKICWGPAMNVHYTCVVASSHLGVSFGSRGHSALAVKVGDRMDSEL